MSGNQDDFQDRMKRNIETALFADYDFPTLTEDQYRQVIERQCALQVAYGVKSMKDAVANVFAGNMSLNAAINRERMGVLDAVRVDPDWEPDHAIISRLRENERQCMVRIVALETELAALRVRVAERDASVAWAIKRGRS